MLTCFSFLDQAVNRQEEGYQNYWYDVDDDPIEGQVRTFTIVPEKLDGEIYVYVDSYHKNMIPSPECNKGIN